MRIEGDWVARALRRRVDQSDVRTFSPTQLKMLAAIPNPVTARSVRGWLPHFLFNSFAWLPGLSCYSRHKRIEIEGGLFCESIDD